MFAVIRVIWIHEQTDDGKCQRERATVETVEKVGLKLVKMRGEMWGKIKTRRVILSDGDGGVFHVFRHDE